MIFESPNKNKKYLNMAEPIINASDVFFNPVST
jgi:hypothetical protein